ncbi:uncharacterized protein [Phaseolus vulgaris]|uniref:uncharacterized protein n=1 Tax=Phaseolus vulgaris TaxID=3885 RepID=UPI0035CC983A
MKEVLALVIDEHQSAFLRNRGLLDSVLIANEVVEEVRRNQRSALCFKVDYEKAYDLVRWNFLLDMLHRLGFHSKWIKWVTGCLKSSSNSVLVNGSPTEEFKPSRGLRQGDPLAPFLFLVVAEGLAGLVRQASKQKMLTGVKVGRDIAIPFKYLGLEIGGNPGKASFWEPAINRINARLSSWKGKFLSMAGRICLIKSVFTSILLFYPSLFKAPASVFVTRSRVYKGFFCGSGVETTSLYHGIDSGGDWFLGRRWMAMEPKMEEGEVSMGIGPGGRIIDNSG